MVVSGVLGRYCTQYGITEPDQDKAVRALSKAMANASSIANCDVCGGDSDAELDCCPFCGDAEIELPEEPVKKKAVNKKTTAKAAPKAKASDTTAAPKKKTATKAKAAAPKAKADQKGARAIVNTTGEEVSQLAYSKEVKAGIKKVHQLQQKGIECMWQLGKELYNIYEQKLHLQITDGTGKPAYDDWTNFCRKELAISKAYAFKLMDVAVCFDKEQVAEIGVTKLNLLVRVPEEKREELLAQAKDIPRTKLADEVRKLAGGKPRETGRGKFRGESGKGRTAATQSEKITVMRSEPRVVVDLFKRNTTDRAHDIQDAVGVERAANGVVVYYSLLRTEHGLSVIVETRRES